MFPFKRKTKTGPASRPEDRLIFQFTENGKTRKADPLAVHRRLISYQGFELETELKLALSSTPEAPKALGHLCEAVRAAFQLLPFEEGGLTDSECLTLLIAFSSWVEAKKKALNPSPTSSPPTDLPSSPNP